MAVVKEAVSLVLPHVSKLHSGEGEEKAPSTFVSGRIEATATAKRNKKG